MEGYMDRTRSSYIFRLDSTFKSRFRFILFNFTLLFLISINSIGAEIYYVDFVTGNDSNTGLSTNDVFKHAPGDQNAASVSASITLSPGDTVVFRGGTVHQTRLYCQWSGSESAPIIYTSGHMSPYSWGNSMAILDGSAIPSVDPGEGVITLQQVDYIEIRGLDVRGLPIGSYGYSGKIAINVSEHVTISDCSVHLGGGNGIMVYGIWDVGSRAYGLTIKNSDIYENQGHGILMLRGIENVLIEGNTVYDNGYPNGTGQSDGIFIKAQGPNTPKNVVIRGNTIYDNPGKGPVLVAGEDILIENNYFWDSGTGGEDTGDKIGLEVNSSGLTRNVIIRNNVFDTAPFYPGVIRIQTEWSSDAVIDGVKIYNNTIINSGAYHVLVLSSSYSTKANAITNVEFINNIVKMHSNSHPVAIKIDDTSVIQGFYSDHNHYVYGQDRTPKFSWLGVMMSLDEWQSERGFDTFDYQHGVDPRIDDSFQLLPDSPSIDKGTSLSGFSVDRDGNSRPAGVNWDIGASEFTGVPAGGTSPSEPTGLRIQ